MGGINHSCDDVMELISKLPELMRRQGWIKGAILMEKWQRGSPNSIPESGNHDVSTINMAWVLGHGRAQNVYKEAVKEKLWVDETGRNCIVNNLIRERNRLPNDVGERVNIGNVGEGLVHTPCGLVEFQNDWQIQLKKHKEKYSADPDDLTAALANFQFCYTVKGWVDRLADRNGKTRYKVTINKVGVFVQDTYDFNDTSWEDRFYSQNLGVWNCENGYLRKILGVPFINQYSLQNKVFRDWRIKYRHGGDFLVYSDIKVLDTNDSFEFSSLDEFPSWNSEEYKNKYCRAYSG